MSVGRRARWYAAFVAHTFAYFQAFKLPHRDHEAQRRRLRIDYVIRADRLIGGGVVPGARLQRLRRRPRVKAILDRVFAAIYFAWAPQRHVALLWLLARHPKAFPRAAGLVCATFDLTLAYHAAAPTAPPWWSAQQGRLTDGLHRVTVEASRELPLAPAEDADARSEANPWASMPSNHTASAVMVALVLADVDGRVGAAAAAYAASLAVALVYLGEHYVADVLAGAMLAAALHAAAAAGGSHARRRGAAAPTQARPPPAAP